MNEEMRLAKISVMLNNAVRVNSGNRVGKAEAYSNTIKLLEKSIQNLMDDHKKKHNFRSKSDKKDEGSIEKNYQEKFFDQGKIVSEQKKSFQKEEDLEKGILQPNKAKKENSPRKRIKMKWKDYLEKQVQKYKKDSKDQAKKHELSVEKPQKFIDFSSNSKIKEYEADLTHFQTVEIKDNFKRLDEQECFIEEDPNNETVPAEPTKILSVKLPLTHSEPPSPNKVQSNIELLPHSSVNPADALEKTKEILQRYEKIIGRPRSKHSGQDIDLVPDKRASGLKRPNSTFSHYSTETQKEVFMKLQKLEEQEEKIQKEKEELIKFLESRSQIRQSSRPATVASLYPKKENSIQLPIKSPNPRPNFPEIISLNRPGLKSTNSRASSVAEKNPKKTYNEVSNLINSLF